ncbi:MAG TPA: transcriptional regulator, partial [Nocardioidaceae bacterium]
DDYTLLRMPSRMLNTKARLVLRFLGDKPPHIAVGGRQVSMTMRRAELLTLLAASPAGMSADTLTLQLYGDEGNSTTTRAELHRVRQILGDRISAKPYRLTGPFSADFLDVREHVLRGRVDDALRLYAGPLLPGSTSLAVELLRDELHAMMRRAVIQAGRKTLEEWVESPHGAGDLDAICALLDLLPGYDHRRPVLQARADRLASEYGVPG